MLYLRAHAENYPHLTYCILPYSRAVSFGRDACPIKAPQSQTLVQVLSATAKRVPVVIGQASKSLEQMHPEEARALRASGFDENGLLLQPLIELPAAQSGSAIQVRLMRLNEDVQRVPLEWRAYEEQDSRR